MKNLTEWLSKQYSTVNQTGLELKRKKVELKNMS